MKRVYATSVICTGGTSVSRRPKHRERLHFHPYAYELANLVRSGYMDRGEAISRLEERADPGIVDMVVTRLSTSAGAAEK